jgi:hypothetical protein
MHLVRLALRLITYRSLSLVTRCRGLLSNIILSLICSSSLGFVGRGLDGRWVLVVLDRLALLRWSGFGGSGIFFVLFLRLR